MTPIDRTPRPPAEGLAHRAETFRRFNRFYTQKIGVLQDRPYAGPFSLAELRVLYELAHQEKPTAVEINRKLGLDQGYLSRILRKFERLGLLGRTRSDTDRRVIHLALTAEGLAALAPLDARAHEDVAAMLRDRSDSEQVRLLDAMHTVEEILGRAPARGVTCFLRAHRPGDLGWVIERHGSLYARERRWDEKFEGLVAGIVASFAAERDPLRERCWIAEKDGERVGCVFLVAKSKTVAQLRLLLVEPGARGRGIGSRLIDECVQFAREAGYRKVVLWTDSGLAAARRLYERARFTKTGEKRHESFGHELVSQTWELDL